MEKDKASKDGLRVEILQGTNEAVGLDQVVSDFLHGDVKAVLRDLHEPGGETPTNTDT